MFDRLSQITLALAKKGGGGGGSTNYNDLDHKPKINNVELAGSLSLSDLDAQEELTAGTGINITGSTISVDADSAPTKNSQKPVTSGGTKSAIDASQNASLQMLKDTAGWTGKNGYIGDDPRTFVKSSTRAYSAPTIFPCNVGKSYKVSFDVDSMTNFDTTKTNLFGLRFDRVGTAGSVSDSVVYINSVVSGRQEFTLTINTDYPNDKIAVYFFINNNQNDNATIIISDVMVMDASVSDDTFEPYYEPLKNEVSKLSPTSQVVELTSSAIENGITLDSNNNFEIKSGYNVSGRIRVTLSQALMPGSSHYPLIELHNKPFIDNYYFPVVYVINRNAPYNILYELTGYINAQPRIMIVPPTGGWPAGTYDLAFNYICK